MATLAGCEDKVEYQNEMNQVGATRAVKVLTTEDGTTLWAYDPPNEGPVYFTSTSTMRHYGKGQRQMVTSAPPQAAEDSSSSDAQILTTKRNDDGTITVTIKP